ncbi:MAG TPA: hypothetical protein VNW92_10995, partial [Polyangiaceae bacterium]|nr:hypothetical protein [Polyangiaceae bacterium]
NEAWSHRLDPRTTTRLGSGLSLTRNSQPDGLIYYSVYPNFSAGITHSSLLGRSTLTLGSTLASAPYIDPVRALVDPSLTAAAFVGLGRDRFLSTLTAGSAVAVVTHGNNGALNTVNGAFTVSYRLGAGFFVDSGLRAAWQTFGGLTTIPPSVAAFAGITMGAQVPLNGGR